jgi:hypothetical protein
MTNSGEFVGTIDDWTEIFVPNDNVFKTCIRGNSSKNIFVTGHFGLVAHWNNKTWYRYDQFFRQPQGIGDRLESVWTSDRLVFVVGRTPNARGIVYRGRQ